MDQHNESASPPQRGWRPSDLPGAQAQLEQIDGLRTLPPDELNLLAGIATLRAYEPGRAMLIERTVPYMLLLIVQGSVSMSIGERTGHPALITLLGRGDITGEGGLFGMRYRRVTTRAESRVYALQLQYSELRPLLPRLPSFHKQLRRLFHARLLQITLANVPLLGSLTAIERLALSAELEERQYERGDIILEIGSDNRSLYIISEGQAQVVRDERTVSVMGPGELFGEIELLSNAPTIANVRAMTPVRLLLIPLVTFRQLLGEHPDIAAGLQALVNQRYQLASDSAYLTQLEATVTSGLIRGPRALARIPALCPPDCHRCEAGCADRFGAARIHLGGTTFGATDLLHGCQHCTWAPECVAACPEDAIKLDDHGFLYINDRCTGCGACAPACPYTAIEMIPLYPAVHGVLARLRRHVQPPVPLRLQPNKCDGCHGYDDQACFLACPTGSLRWISAREVLADRTDRPALAAGAPD